MPTIKEHKGSVKGYSGGAGYIAELRNWEGLGLPKNSRPYLGQVDYQGQRSALAALPSRFLRVEGIGFRV